MAKSVIVSSEKVPKPGTVITPTLIIPFFLLKRSWESTSSLMSGAMIKSAWLAYFSLSKIGRSYFIERNSEVLARIMG